MERVMVNTALQYLRKNDVINQSAPLEELPEEYEEPDASDVEAIPQKVLMQFIEELPAGASPSTDSSTILSLPSLSIHYALSILLLFLPIHSSHEIVAKVA